jgi:hypothetical protein
VLKIIKKNKKQSDGNPQTNLEMVNFVCIGCRRENETIPLSVVRDFDDMDAGDLEVPLRFVCEACGGDMYPEYYKGVHGYEFRIEDILGAEQV